MISRDQLEDMIEAYVLDLVDAQEMDAFERALHDHPDLMERVAELQRTLAGLALDEDAVAPAGLRTAVFATATDRRTPGSVNDAVLAASPAVCYAESVAELSSLVDQLSSGDWSAGTIYQIPVVELLSHLSGVEAEIAAALASENTTTRSTRSELTDHRSVREDVDLAVPGDVATSWRRRVAATNELISLVVPDRLSDEVVFSGSSWSIDVLLVVRAFEVWTHTDDIRRATGRSLAPPSPPVVRAMTEAAIDLLVPLIAHDSRHAGRKIRLTLTGAGGGSWIRQLDAQPRLTAVLDQFATADATLIADAIDFCRVVADRLDPRAELDAHRLGDHALLDHLLDAGPGLADFGAGPLQR